MNREQASEMIDAARAVLDAQQALAQAVERKNAALVAIHESGVPKARVAQIVRDSLTWPGGFTEEEWGRLALSPGSVRLALDRPARSSSEQPSARS